MENEAVAPFKPTFYLTYVDDIFNRSKKNVEIFFSKGSTITPKHQADH